MPKLASGVAFGVTTYLTAGLKVLGVGTGTVGAGVTLIPLITPPPLLKVALLGGFTAQGILGVLAPWTITGLANGISQGLVASALVQITWPGIGVGAGTAKFVGSSAIPAMIAGFASQAMTNSGSVKTATAIGIALDTVFQSLIVPVPIVGGAAPAPSAGAGFGFIL